MTFFPMETILVNCQNQCIDLLNDCKLLNKWNKDVKAIFLFVFLKEWENSLQSYDFITLSRLPEIIDLFAFIPKEKITKLLNQTIQKLKKYYSDRLIIISSDIMIPSEIENHDEMCFWYGSFYDEFIKQIQHPSAKTIQLRKKYIKSHLL